MEVALFVLVGVVSAGGGYALGRYKARFRWPMQEPTYSQMPTDPEHVHSFDTMHSDGWWRCSCNAPAPDEKQPVLKVVD